MWLSVHLFYSDLDQLLTKAVFPFVHQMKAQNAFSQYFFIRYSEGGKHVRLRMKTTQLDFLKATVTHYFNTFFKNYPFQKAVIQEQIYPNNSIQHIDYQPEWQRYGGQKGLLVAEQQFQLSSETVQAIMVADSDWSYESLIGVALQLHLVFMKAVGFDTIELKPFWCTYFKKWAVIVPENYHPTENHILQQTTTLDFIQDFWHDLNTIEAFEDEILQKWYNQNKKLIDLPFFQSFYDSYVHMTNNRLGISNIDELLIARLIEMSFQ